jgi:hypothetical protein
VLSSLPATNAKRLRKGAKRRSNPFFLFVARWIASRGLSSRARSRDPLARKDNLKDAPHTPNVIACENFDPRSCGVLDRPVEPGDDG